MDERKDEKEHNNRKLVFETEYRWTRENFKKDVNNLYYSVTYCIPFAFVYYFVVMLLYFNNKISVKHFRLLIILFTVIFVTFCLLLFINEKKSLKAFDRNVEKNNNYIKYYFYDDCFEVTMNDIDSLYSYELIENIINRNDKYYIKINGEYFAIDSTIITKDNRIFLNI